MITTYNAEIAEIAESFGTVIADVAGFVREVVSHDNSMRQCDQDKKICHRGTENTEAIRPVGLRSRPTSRTRA
jgi:hypothetical protein